MLKNIRHHFNFTNISLIIRGYPMIKAWKKLHYIDSLPLRLFDEFLIDQKKRIVDFHIRQNLFYQNLVKDPNEWTWDSLPIITKEDIQVNLKDRIPSIIKQYYISKTSGSSGNPFYYAKDKFCHALTWSYIQKCFSEHKVYGKKQARFYGISKDFMSYYSTRIKDFFLNRYRFNVFDLNDSAFEKWLINFSKNKYIYLNGYTSVMILFSKYLKSKGIILSEICPSLKKCIVTSEMCFEDDKNLMETYFGIPVVNEYGASELDLIAFENSDNEWIINTSTLFVEILDKNNLPVADGQTGRIIITSLFNKANPFIRYDVGDMGSIYRVNSKKVILKNLEGRSEDFVLLPNGNKAIGLTFYYVTKSVIEKSNEIKEIKIIQTDIDAFKIEYVSKYELSIEQKKEILRSMIDFLKYDIKVSYEKLNNLRRNKSGKLKQFTSLVKNK